MFGLLARSPRTRKLVARPTTTLFLERLEDRLSPSAALPTETVSLGVQYLPDKEVVFTGKLTNPFGSVSNQTIDLTGVVKATAITNGLGNFIITLSIPQLGTEYAASADGHSNTAQVTLAGGKPTISNFAAVAEGGGMWLFEGKVSGVCQEGEVINFGGITALQGQSTTPNQGGIFEFYAIVKSGQGGWATAEAVDWWGDTSPVASTYVAA
jgi:hypothetical protein